MTQICWTLLTCRTRIRAALLLIAAHEAYQHAANMGGAGYIFRRADADPMLSRYLQAGVTWTGGREKAAAAILSQDRDGPQRQRDRGIG